MSSAVNVLHARRLLKGVLLSHCLVIPLLWLPVVLWASDLPDTLVTENLFNSSDEYVWSVDDYMVFIYLSSAAVTVLLLACLVWALSFMQKNKAIFRPFPCCQSAELEADGAPAWMAVPHAGYDDPDASSVLFNYNDPRLPAGFVCLAACCLVLCTLSWLMCGYNWFHMVVYAHRNGLFRRSHTILYVCMCVVVVATVGLCYLGCGHCCFPTQGVGAASDSDVDHHSDEEGLQWTFVARSPADQEYADSHRHTNSHFSLPTENAWQSDGPPAVVEAGGRLGRPSGFVDRELFESDTEIPVATQDEWLHYAEHGYDDNDILDGRL